MDVRKNITTENYNKGSESRIRYIVVHYTGNNGDTAYANTNYFKQYRGASAHYFVDDKEICQSIEDKDIAWHCGAKTYSHPECRNTNSLGVEICSKKDNRGFYYFDEKAIEKAVELVRYLMKKYNVPLEKVVRHYDVTRKICPEPFVRNIKDWEEFKEKLVEEVIEKKIIRICGKDRKCDVIFKDGFNFIKLQDLNQEERIAVTYDKEKKIPKIDVY